MKDGSDCLQSAAGEGHKERHENGVLASDWHCIVRISGGPQGALWLSRVMMFQMCTCARGVSLGQLRGLRRSPMVVKICLSVCLSVRHIS